MKPHLLRLALISMLLAPAIWLGGCGATSASRPTPTSIASPTVPAPEGTFYFKASDGVTLNGQIFGGGKTALIFSNGFGTTTDSWRLVAETLAGHGYMCLLYDYRGQSPSQGANNPQLRGNDLRSAIATTRAHGATKVVLIGADFGGMLSAKVAPEADATAIVLVSAILSRAGVSLSDDELHALTMPKLLLVSENDGAHASDSRNIYDTSPQPKQLVVYPGRQRGATLFVLDHKGDVMARLMAFLDKYAPAR